MKMNMNQMATGVALAAGGMGAVGAIEAPAADASLTGFGPAFSHNIKQANVQLDARLNAEGADGCISRAIGKIAGITTHAGRATYITAENVDFGKIVTATKRKYPINTGGAANCAPVEIPNEHPSSAAATIVMEDAPQKTQLRAKKLKNGKIEITKGVERLDCGGNALLQGNKPKKSKPTNETRTRVNVSFGVKARLSALALSKSASTSSSTSVIHCPGGQTFTNKSAASSEATALSSAAARVGVTEQVIIEGDNMSFGQFEAELNADINAYVTAATNTSANTVTYTDADCGTPPVTPHNPNIVVTKDFIASYNTDGTLYSTVATKHGDTDRWAISVTNTGDEDLKTNFTDTPPKGEKVIPEATSPFGLQIDGFGLGRFPGINTLTVGETENYKVSTRNVNAPCFEDLRNVITVVGTDAVGVEVSDDDDAFTKEANTGPDCINQLPPAGGGGPIQP